MWGLFDLLRFSFSSIIWGILITIICFVLFFFLIQGWYKNAAFTPMSYVIGIILFLFLAFQCTMIVCAIKIIIVSHYYEAQIQQLINSYFSYDQEITKQESEQLIGWLVNEYPILQHYFNSGEFVGYTALELPQAVGEAIRSFLRFYILRRLLWCLGFVIVGAILVIKSISKGYERKVINTRKSYPSSRMRSHRRF